MDKKEKIALEKEINALLDAFFILLEYTEKKRTKQFELYTYIYLKGFVRSAPILEIEDFGRLIKDRMLRFVSEDEAGELKKEIKGGE